MTLKERLINDVKDAMRAQDKNRLTTLRLITAAVKQIEVDERVEVDDQRLIAVLTKMTKQRKESIAQFEKANRDDLVNQELSELEIIAQYLPAPLSNEEIEKMVDQAVLDSAASTLADMGKVMTLVKDALQGRADMAQVSALIRAKLS
mgnify:CR=1 FL=1